MKLAQIEADLNQAELTRIAGARDRIGFAIKDVFVGCYFANSPATLQASERDVTSKDFLAGSGRSRSAKKRAKGSASGTCQPTSRRTISFS